MNAETQPTKHPSPPLGMVATVFVLLFVGSIVLSGLLTNGTPFPTPYSPIDDVQTYYVQYANVIRLMALLQFGSSIPLGIFAAAVTSRLLFFGIRAAGVHIGFFGGLGASVFLAVSSLTSWVISQTGVASEPGTLRALQLLGFATGGVGHIVTLGLLVAGVAATAGFTGWLPRWLMWIGLVLAVLAEVSTLSLLLPQVAVLLPLSRFPAYLWLIVVGFTLKSTRLD